MPNRIYPTAADVEALLKSASYWPTDATKQAFAQLQAQIGAEAAAGEWESLTGWAPFLASGETAERLFDATDTNGFLDLEGGAVEITEVVIGAGSPLMLNESYWLSPANAAGQEKPFTGLVLTPRYASTLWTKPQRIGVTARWGYTDSLPADVFQAVLQKAALIALTQVENLQSIASISQDGFNKAFDVVGIISAKDLSGIWSKDFTKLANRYKRVTC